MADRPKECRGCHKRLNVKYRTIVGNTLNEVCACEGCPAITSKLKSSSRPSGDEFDDESSLSCSSCGTTLNHIQSGTTLGCAECYTVFSDYIKVFLKSNDRMKEGEKGVIRTLEGNSLHVGKTPFGTEDENLTSRLCDLNDALNDALKIENYEQAAWLRDRIKTLTETPSDGQQQAS